MWHASLDILPPLIGMLTEANYVMSLLIYSDSPAFWGGGIDKCTACLVADVADNGMATTGQSRLRLERMKPVVGSHVYGFDHPASTNSHGMAGMSPVEWQGVVKCRYIIQIGVNSWTQWKPYEYVQDASVYDNDELYVYRCM